MTNNHLTYIWEFKKNGDSIWFIKEWQDEFTKDVDFDQEVEIILVDPAHANLKQQGSRNKGASVELTRFVARSINDILQKNPELVVDKPNTTVTILNYFSQ